MTTHLEPLRPGATVGPKLGIADKASVGGRKILGVNLPTASIDAPTTIQTADSLGRMAISSVAEFGKIVLCSFMTPLSFSKLRQNYLTKNRITTKKGNF
jgi:hypothetical protein